MITLLVATPTSVVHGLYTELSSTPTLLQGFLFVSIRYILAFWDINEVMMFA